MKQSLRVAKRDQSEFVHVLRTASGQARQRKRDERGFIAFAAVRDRCEIRGIGLHEQSIIGDNPQERLIGPTPKRDDAAKADIPANIEGRFGQWYGAGVAVEDADHPGRRRPLEKRKRIELGLARVENEGTAKLGSKRQLRIQRMNLLVAG